MIVKRIYIDGESTNSFEVYLDEQSATPLRIVTKTDLVIEIEEYKSKVLYLESILDKIAE